jgi:hypothetical protein
MDSKEFFDLVAKMRRKQKDYFATRSKAVLQESKALEKQVDDEIKRVEDILKERREPKLF